MIFLGAGTSAPFGIPTAKTLTTDIRGMLAEEHQELLNDIDNYWRDTHEGREPNYENILTFLMGLSRPSRIPRGSLVRAFMKDFPKHKKDFMRIVGEMYSKIVNYCTDPFVVGEKYLTPIKLESIFECTYDLFALFGKEVVFTTNYDPSIEIWCQKRNIQLLDNTNPTRNPEIREVIPFNESTVASGNTNLPFSARADTPDVPTLKILRLHGSVWVYETEKKKRIKMTRPRDRRLFTDSYGGLDRRPLMIFPGQESILGTGEWDVSYQYFKKMLRGNCLVVGYSFQDEMINRAFVDSMEKGQMTALGILNPHPGEVLKNLFLEKDVPHQKIIEIPAKFGTNQAIYEIGAKWINQVLRMTFPTGVERYLDAFRSNMRRYLE